MPTTLEAGYKDSDFPILDRNAGAGQDAASIVDRLNAETIKAIKVPAHVGSPGEGWHHAADHDADEFDARIKAEIASNIAVAKAAGIKPN